MRRAKITDKIELHSQDLARAGRHNLELLAFSPRHVRSRGESLEPRHWDVGDTLGAPIDAVRIQRDVSYCINTFFVGFQILVHRASAQAAEWSICYELQIRFCADGNDREPRGKSQAAFGLDILDNCFAFESVQVLVEQQLDTGFLKEIG